MSDQSQKELIRDAARRFAADHPPRKGESLNDVSQQTVAGMAQLGWFGMLVPEAHQGLGLDFTTAAAMVEELGQGLAAEPLVGIAVLTGVEAAEAKTKRDEANLKLEAVRNPADRFGHLLRKNCVHHR